MLRLTGVVTPVGLAVINPGTGHNRGLATARHNTCGAVHHGTGDAVAGPAAVAAGHPTAQQCCRYKHSVAISQHESTDYSKLSNTVNDQDDIADWFAGLALKGQE